MAAQIVSMLETVTIAISGFLIKKYVLLEPDMEAGKQRLFYWLTAIITGVVFLAFGKDAATLTVLFLIGINSCLGRKEHHLLGLLMMLPLPGIINGLLVPVLLVLPYLLSLSVQESLIYQFIMYGVLFVVLLVFYVKSKAWRDWFQENMQHRRLRISEQFLLFVIGILLLFFSNAVSVQTEMGRLRTLVIDENYGNRLVSFIGISSIAAFIMTITIIVLIMQGNKRSFYHEQVSGMQSGMITLMAEIVENRDDNTGGHIRRTAKYVEAIAKQLKKKGVYRDILTDEYMRDMIVAAPLHDIGKIHIADAILNKPGKLTEEEFEEMKTHAAVGQELLMYAKEELGESGYLNTAVDMAAYHHEWWNGNGYPYGIAGKEIPLCARIMAVADVFDALTSKRCYKSAMPLEKAYAIIREEAGTHFDPSVVEAFFAATKERDDIINNDRMEDII